MKETGVAAGRKLWIDVYKGIAILLVVLGHLDIPIELYRFIFSFHMYAFFFISGVTFRVKQEQSFWAFLKDNIRRLLFPYLVFAFAWDITHLGIGLYQGELGILSLADILKNIVSILLGGDFGTLKSTAVVGPAWFLLSLFVVRTVFYLLVRLLRNNTAAIGLVCAGLFALGYLCNGAYFLPFKIIPSLTAFFFVFLGYGGKTFAEKLRDWKDYLWALCGLTAIMLVYTLSKHMDKDLILAGNSLPDNWLLTLGAGIAGCLGLMFLSFLLEKVPVLSRGLSFLGVNSLAIMGFHSQIRVALNLVFERIGLPTAPKEILIFVITIGLSIPIINILNRYFPFLVGKRKEVRHDNGTIST